MSVVALVAGACGTTLPAVTPDDPDDAGSDASGSADGGAEVGSELDASLPSDVAVSGDGGCNRAIDCERVVFVTSKQFRPSDLGGVAGARDRCNDLAAKSTHVRVGGRKFLPWLSDATSNPATAMAHGMLAYKLPSGSLVAPSWSGLNGPLLHAIDEDENGTSLASEEPVVWTGTNADGSGTGFHCLGWNTGAQSMATVGYSANITSTQWSNKTTEQCDAEDHRIYCFEE